MDSCLNSDKYFQSFNCVWIFICPMFKWIHHPSPVTQKQLMVGSQSTQNIGKHEINTQLKL